MTTCAELATQYDEAQARLEAFVTQCTGVNPPTTVTDTESGEKQDWNATHEILRKSAQDAFDRWNECRKTDATTGTTTTSEEDTFLVFGRIGAGATHKENQRW